MLTQSIYHYLIAFSFGAIGGYCLTLPIKALSSLKSVASIAADIRGS